MKNSVKSLMVAAAVSGLFSGAMTVQAATMPSSSAPLAVTGHAAPGSASLSFHAPKHACKGQNNCKGQGGCKSSDNGCKGKNSCKGKGGCATDGSKMPE